MVKTTDREENGTGRLLNRVLAGIQPAMSRPLPPCATRALPGSAEKIRVMQWRYDNGFHVHHPNDAKFADDPRITLRQMIRDFDNRPIHPNDAPEDTRTIVQKALDEADGLPWAIEEVM